jgi:hypothetical protein
MFRSYDHLQVEIYVLLAVQTHPNDLATNLFDDEGEVRRLKKFKPSDLSTRFD